MAKKLRKWWAALLAWLHLDRLGERPLSPPEDPEEYHTMNRGNGE